MTDPIPDRARKGRGAVGNPTGRYEAAQRVAEDDGWGLSPPVLRRTAVAAAAHDAGRRFGAENNHPQPVAGRALRPLDQPV